MNMRESECVCEEKGTLRERFIEARTLAAHTLTTLSRCISSWRFASMRSRPRVHFVTPLCISPVHFAVILVSPPVMLVLCC
jgi:hypothetical protein